MRRFLPSLRIPSSSETTLALQLSLSSLVMPSTSASGAATSSVRLLSVSFSELLFTFITEDDENAIGKEGHESEEDLHH